MRNFSLIALSLSSLVMSLDAFAFSVSPMTLTFSPSGSDAAKVYQVTNETNELLTVEIYATERDKDASGLEISRRTDKAKNSFVIFPSQLIVKAGEKRSVRVAYVGDKSITSEANYRMTFKQVPVKTDNTKKAQRGLQFNIAIAGAVYVTPEAAKPKIVLKSARYVKGSTPAGSKDLLEMVFVNTGGAHRYFERFALKVSTESSPPKTVVIKESKALKGLDGLAMLGNHSMTAQISWPKDIPVGTAVTADVEFNE
jgi:fimbrial chaperone protein